MNIKGIIMFRLLLFITLLATPALAEPVQYRLDKKRSEVSFIYQFEGTATKGRMPVHAAEMWIDPNNLSASRVDVTLNAHAARAGFVVATDMMKGTEVLDTRNHPHIRFQSADFKGNMQGATVKGTLTVRGVSRPATLRATLYRQSGTAPGDTRNLTVLLTGTIDRTEFGASGFPGFVGRMIELRIIARISR